MLDDERWLFDNGDEIKFTHWFIIKNKKWTANIVVRNYEWGNIEKGKHNENKSHKVNYIMS